MICIIIKYKNISFIYYLIVIYLGGYVSDDVDIVAVYNAAVKAVKPFLGKNFKKNVENLSVEKQVEIAQKVYAFVSEFDAYSEDDFEDDTYKTFRNAADKLPDAIEGINSSLEEHGSTAVLVDAYNRILDGEDAGGILVEYTHEYEPEVVEAEEVKEDGPVEKFYLDENFDQDVDERLADLERMGERLTAMSEDDKRIRKEMEESAKKREEIKERLEEIKSRNSR